MIEKMNIPAVGNRNACVPATPPALSGVLVFPLAIYSIINPTPTLVYRIFAVIDRKLSKEVGISHNNLAIYEKDKITTSLKNAIKICKSFNIPLEYLFIGEKAGFKYHDIELSQLASVVDKSEPEYRTIVKNYINKIIEHRNKKLGIEKEPTK